MPGFQKTEPPGKLPHLPHPRLGRADTPRADVGSDARADASGDVPPAEAMKAAVRDDRITRFGRISRDFF